MSTEDALWDLEALGEARGLVQWQFDQFADLVAGTVLEVGAGVGTFTQLLLDRGARRVLAIEPHPEGAAAARARFGDDARVVVAEELLPDAPSLEGVAGACDLVICQNVLEHIDDDGAAMAAMARSLAPGGRLTLLVPAGPRLFNRLDERYGHHRRYTRQRLVDLAAPAGLQLEHLRSFNLLGVPGWFVQGRRRSPSISPASLRVYEAALRVWRPIEDRLHLPGGLSLVARYRRA